MATSSPLPIPAAQLFTSTSLPADIALVQAGQWIDFMDRMSAAD
jgi:hypothetical protein